MIVSSCKEEANDLTDNCKKVIVTNNPNIDIPKVVDEAERLAREFATKPANPLNPISTITCLLSQNGFEKGYSKSQETYSNSDEDMTEFVEWINKNEFLQYADKLWSSSLIEYSGCLYSTKELLQLWKEQQPKIVYYNG